MGQGARCQPGISVRWGEGVVNLGIPGLGVYIHRQAMVAARQKRRRMLLKHAMHVLDMHIRDFPHCLFAVRLLSDSGGVGGWLWVQQSERLCKADGVRGRVTPLLLKIIDSIQDLSKLCLGYRVLARADVRRDRGNKESS